MSVTIYRYTNAISNGSGEEWINVSNAVDNITGTLATSNIPKNDYTEKGEMEEYIKGEIDGEDYTVEIMTRFGFQVKNQTLKKY